MKRSNVITMLIIILLLIFVINIIYQIYYFRNLHSNNRQPTELEKERAMQILVENNITYSKIDFINIRIMKDNEIMQIALIKNNSTARYLIDLKSEKVIKR